jgi:hypothetical protein
MANFECCIYKLPHLKTIISATAIAGLDTFARLLQGNFSVSKMIANGYIFSIYYCDTYI